MKKGDIVVDLGAAPGGWIQASRKIVGETGFILGVDQKEIDQFPETNIVTMACDIIEPETTQKILAFLHRKADVVISDVAPNISGVWEVDHARQIDLATQSLKIALTVLRQSGSFFVKVFQGDLLNKFIKEVDRHFEKTKLTKPKASRPKSSEMYLIGFLLK